MIKLIKMLRLVPFLVFLFMPSIFTVMDWNVGYFIAENRHRRSMPEGNMLAKIWSTPGYANEFNSYVNDNYPMRDFLIRCKNQIDFSFFNESDGIYLGNEQYMFYKAVIDGEEILNEKMNEAQFSALCDAYSLLCDSLLAKGVEPFFLVCPQKNTVYPELFPNNPVKRPSPTVYERLLQYFNTTPKFKGRYLDSRERLHQAEKPSFYKYDFHWTHYAGMKIGDDLLKLICLKLGVEKPLEGLGYDEYFTPGKFTGGQYAEMTCFTKMEEDLQFGKDVVSLPPITQVKLDPIPEIARNFCFETDNSSGSLLPEIVFVGNSFKEYMLQGGYFIKHFEKAWSIHTADIKNIIFPKSTRIMVFQSIEASIYRDKPSLDEILSWIAEDNVTEK